MAMYFMLESLYCSYKLWTKYKIELFEVSKKEAEIGGYSKSEDNCERSTCIGVSPERNSSVHSKDQLNLKQNYRLNFLGISEHGVCAAKVAEYW